MTHWTFVFSNADPIPGRPSVPEEFVSKDAARPVQESALATCSCRSFPSNSANTDTDRTLSSGSSSAVFDVSYHRITFHFFSGSGATRPFFGFPSDTRAGAVSESNSYLIVYQIGSGPVQAVAPK